MTQKKPLRAKLSGGNVETAKANGHSRVSDSQYTTIPKRAHELLFDERAEQSVLGAILIDPTAFHRVAFLNPHMFGIERHMLIFAAMQRLAETQTDITVDTLAWRLREDNHFETVGGLSYIVALLQSIPSPTYIQASADLVYRFHLKRSLAHVSTQIAEIAYDSKNLEPHQIIDAARAKLDSINVAPIAAQDPWDKFKRTLANAYAERPPQEFIVDGVFASSSLNIIYGAPGTLKSMLLADLCICVAAGLPWLAPLPNANGLPFQTKQAPVLWLDFDNGQNRTDERFDAFGRTRAIDATAPLTYYAMPTPWFDATDDKAIEMLICRIEKTNAQLVVIDNLGVISGGADENSAEMASVMANLRRVAETTRTALIIVHHQRKGTSNNTRAGESLRGHSSIEAALDLALLVERDERSEIINIKATKARGVDVPPFGAHFTYDHKIGTKELATARFFGVQVEDSTSDRAIEYAIIEAVSGNAGINKGELVKSVKMQLPKIGEKRVRQIIERLEVSGSKLQAIMGNHGSRRYQLSN